MPKLKPSMYFKVFLGILLIAAAILVTSQAIAWFSKILGTHDTDDADLNISNGKDPFIKAEAPKITEETEQEAAEEQETEEQEPEEDVQEPEQIEQEEPLYEPICMDIPIQNSEITYDCDKRCQEYGYNCSEAMLSFKDEQAYCSETDPLDPQLNFAGSFPCNFTLIDDQAANFSSKPVACNCLR